MRTRLRFLGAALLGSSALIAPSVASAATPAPKFITIDDRNVDLTTGLVWFAMEEGAIGSGPGRVSMQRIYSEGAGWGDNWSGGFYYVTSGGVTKAYIRFGGISDSFTNVSGTWTSDKGDGSTLTISSGQPIYTGDDGTKVFFNAPPSSNATLYGTPEACPGSDPGTCYVPQSIVQPNGLKFTLAYQSTSYCAVQPPGEPCAERRYYYRLSQVTSSAANSLSITYAANLPPNVAPTSDWYKRTSVTFTRTVSPPSPLPTVTYSYAPNIVDVTDAVGGTWRFTFGSALLTGIRRPGSTSDNYTYAYRGDGVVSSATKDGIQYSYAKSLGGSPEIVTDPLGNTVTVAIDGPTGRPASYEDELGHTTSYQYDSNARLTRITAPEGNYSQYTYDGRGNVTDIVAHNKDNSASVAAHATYSTACTNPVTCNKPLTTTDPLGNVTQFEYSSVHGGLTKLRPPKPSTNAVQPQTVIGYAQVTSATGDLVWMRTSSSQCQTLTADSCAGTADEAKTTVSYNSNLLPLTVASGSGTTTIATTAMAYDARGNTISVDGPLSGTADTWAFKYDLADRRTGIISPDPDGAGALKFRAIRTTYRPDSQVSSIELGTTLGQSDTDFANIAVAQSVLNSFDTNSRVSMTRLLGGTSRQQQTQFSYDALGRLDCTAVRMDRNQFTSDASLGACALGANIDPRDRITQNVYDEAGNLTQLKVAVGTDEAATERTLSYTNNGMLATLKDAKNNLTTFEYDGFDRQSKTIYPDLSFEQLTYNDNSQPVTFRNRANQTIAFSYDHSGRLTLKDLPGTEFDVSYRYDNLNRPTSVFTKDSGGVTVQNIGFTYDALSRALSEAGQHGTTDFAYDAAGRRTTVDYPGTGLFMNYDYLLTGELTKIRENGATTGIGVLASYGYDDLGNRTSAAFGNGVGQAYTYDIVSRLTSMTTSGVATTGGNLIVDNMSYNPASQIVSERRTGDAFAFHESNTNESGSANAANELTQYAGKTVQSDNNGSVSAFDSDSFAYSSENLLTLADVGGTSTSLTYDPLMRMYGTTTDTATTTFAYEGLDALTEYNAANAVQRRYAFDNAGNPIVWYEGASTSDRRFLIADERGSVVGVTDASANLLAANSYDEYGIPSSGNLGRYGYTGRAWVGSTGLWYLNARMYSPAIGGRFMQADPIGYAGDGPNLYAYVLNDPVNFVDPLGFELLNPPCGGPGCSSDPASGDITVTGTSPAFPGAELAGLFGSFGGFSRLELSTDASGGGKKDRCPRNAFLSALGKANGAINTAIGAVAAGGSALIGALSGYSPQVGFGNNAIQVTNAATIGGRAYTIGNIQVYAPGQGPGVGQPSYSGAVVQNGLHEEGHTVASEILGPFYLPEILIGSAFGDMNPLEIGADKYALGLSCTGL